MAQQKSVVHTPLLGRRHGASIANFPYVPAVLWQGTGKKSKIAWKYGSKTCRASAQPILRQEWVAQWLGNFTSEHL
jgi:hypothetical protein